MGLETIYSVGEGRTVVVAVDGCAGCLLAFEEFLQERQEPEDRIVAVVRGGKGKGSQGKYSGPLLLSKRKQSSDSLEDCHDAEAVAVRPECRVRNRVVVPGEPLDDFADWDKTSCSVLKKLACVAEKHRTRFEAIRVLAGARAHQFAEAVVECCGELDASLLVVASHRSAADRPKDGPRNGRSLSAVFSSYNSCPILVLGKKAPSPVQLSHELRDERPDDRTQPLLSPPGGKRFARSLPGKSSSASDGLSRSLSAGSQSSFRENLHSLRDCVKAPFQGRLPRISLRSLLSPVATGGLGTS